MISVLIRKDRSTTRKRERINFVLESFIFIRLPEQKNAATFIDKNIYTMKLLIDFLDFSVLYVRSSRRSRNRRNYK